MQSKGIDRVELTVYTLCLQCSRAQKVSPHLLGAHVNEEGGLFIFETGKPKRAGTFKRNLSPEANSVTENIANCMIPSRLKSDFMRL